MSSKINPDFSLMVVSGWRPPTNSSSVAAVLDAFCGKRKSKAPVNIPVLRINSLKRIYNRIKEVRKIVLHANKLHISGFVKVECG